MAKFIPFSPQSLWFKDLTDKQQENAEVYRQTLADKIYSELEKTFTVKFSHKELGPTIRASRSKIYKSKTDVHVEVVINTGSKGFVVTFFLCDIQAINKAQMGYSVHLPFTNLSTTLKMQSPLVINAAFFDGVKFGIYCRAMYKLVRALSNTDDNDKTIAIRKEITRKSQILSVYFNDTDNPKNTNIFLMNAQITPPSEVIKAKSLVSDKILWNPSYIAAC